MEGKLNQSNGETKGGVTFAHQEELQKLPIPKLEDSLFKYKDALQPLQTRKEQIDTAAAVDEFLKTDGPELQSRLTKYASDKTSYIEQFCGFRIEMGVTMSNAH